MCHRRENPLQYEGTFGFIHLGERLWRPIRDLPWRSVLLLLCGGVQDVWLSELSVLLGVIAWRSFDRLENVIELSI